MNTEDKNNPDSNQVIDAQDGQEAGQRSNLKQRSRRRVIAAASLLLLLAIAFLLAWAMLGASHHRINITVPLHAGEKPAAGDHPAKSAEPDDVTAEAIAEASRALGATPVLPNA